MTDYLLEADAINLLIDTYFAWTISSMTHATRGRKDAVEQIKDLSNRLPEILDRLDTCLKSELETTSLIQTQEEI